MPRRTGSTGFTAIPSHALARHWARRGLVAAALWPASQVFTGLAAARRFAYRHGLLARKQAGVPVLVVGNVVAGGSGKTPVALWIAQQLRAAGAHPALVARGWGGSAEGIREVSLVSAADEVGDEPLLLARRSGVPVWIGRDRAQVIDALRRRHPAVDLVVLDDGLQHYRLARDLEIAVVDARGFGNGWRLPAGPLREAPGRLATVDAILAHDIEPALLRPYAGAVPIFRMSLEGAQFVRLIDPGARRPATAFAAAPVHAVAGIGDPSRFFRHLERLGLTVRPHAFPDHHRFSAADLAFGDALPVVMTEKDAVKCRAFAQAGHWMLPVDAAPEAGFGDWLRARLERLRDPGRDVARNRTAQGTHA
ncbi:MAG: tetraacyldisaccharide 4'-kinase [Proteobacteria bacterium]|nr:tetraacyldisaccharide 4'-kinase [Pseudomonadota bacterium]